MEPEMNDNPTEEWEVPAVCTKADTLALSALQGAVGIVQLAEAAGPQFDCEVTFLGYKGRWHLGEGRFHGVYRFGPVVGPIEQRKRFTVLPGSGVPVHNVIADESEEDNGIYGDDS